MSHARKIVLHCPRGYEPRIDMLVEEFMRNGVMFVEVVGPDCTRVESVIAQLVVGKGTRERDPMATSSRPGETVAEAVEFVRLLGGNFQGEVNVVEL